MVWAIDGNYLIFLVWHAIPPTFNRFLTNLRMEQSRTEQLYCELSANSVVSVKKREQIKKDDRIFKVVNECNSYDLMFFLRLMNLYIGCEKI